MKYLKLLFVAAMIFGLSACAGSAGYSPEKCKALSEKVKSGEELTESDYNEMIDQLGAAVKVMKDNQEKYAGDKEAEAKYQDSDEAKDLVSTVLGFGIYLSTHKKDLTPANQKHLEEVSEQLKSLNEK